MSQTIIQCDREDIKCELFAIYQEMQAEAKREAEANAMEMLFTPEETTKALKISSTTLWRWAKAKYLTPIYLGGRRLYKRGDILSIIEKQGGDNYGK